MPEYIASHLKDMNRLKVYSLIRAQDRISRAEITRQTGISAPTVLKIVDYLTGTGLVTDVGTGSTGLGRRPQLYVHNPDRYYSVGIVHEGDYLKAGIANLDGRLAAVRRVDARGPMDRVLGGIVFDVVDGLLAETGITREQLLGIGIGLPGIYDPEKREITAAPLIGIAKATSIHDSLDGIGRRYGLPVFADNDLNMEVQGEFQALRLTEEDDLVYISLGTGLGSGVMLGGKLRRGKNFMCGEIGYMSFLDDYVADGSNAGWLENRINLAGLRERFGIEAGAPVAAGVLAAAAEYVSIPLALCVNNIVMCYDCGNVSLGGEVFDLLGDGLFRAVESKVQRISMAKVRLHKKTCPEPGIVGAVNMANSARIPELVSGEPE